jgi:hypothetical protein
MTSVLAQSKPLNAYVMKATKPVKSALYLRFDSEFVGLRRLIAHKAPRAA